MKGQNCIVFVIFAGQQGADPHVVQLFRKGIQLFPDLWNQTFILFLISHLDQGLQIFKLGLKIIASLHDGFQAFQLLHGLAGFLGVLPEGRLLHDSF